MSVRSCVSAARKMHRQVQSLARLAKAANPEDRAALRHAVERGRLERHGWMDEARHEKRESLVRFGSDGQRVQYADAADASEHFLRMAEGLC